MLPTSQASSSTSPSLRNYSFPQHTTEQSESAGNHSGFSHPLEEEMASISADSEGSSQARVDNERADFRNFLENADSNPMLVQAMLNQILGAQGLNLGNQSSLIADHISRSLTHNLTSYFDELTLTDQNPIKKLVLQLLTGFMLLSKKLGEDLPDSADDDFAAAYEQVTFSDLGEESLSVHYKHIKNCLSIMKTETDISKIQNEISTQIKKEISENTWGWIKMHPPLEEAIKQLAHNEFFLKNKHKHDLFCRSKQIMMSLNVILALTHSSAVMAYPIFKGICMDHEARKLEQSLKKIYKKYNKLQQQVPQINLENSAPSPVSRRSLPTLEDVIAGRENLTVSWG